MVESAVAADLTRRKRKNGRPVELWKPYTSREQIHIYIYIYRYICIYIYIGLWDYESLSLFRCCNFGGQSLGFGV